jgi:hypothetical protein
VLLWTTRFGLLGVAGDEQRTNWKQRTTREGMAGAGDRNAVLM